MKRQLLLTLILALLTTICKAENDQDPFYIWNTNKVSGKIGKKFGISIGSKTHYNLTENQTVLNYSQIILKYTLPHHFYVGAGFRQLYYKQQQQWLNENRAMSYLGYINKEKIIDLMFVNRLSYRHFKKATDHFRYYNKLTLLYPVKVLSNPLSPYIAEESFIKLNKNNYNIGRFFIGLKLRDNRKVRLDLYMAHTLLKDSNKEWNKYNMAGANIAIVI